MSELNNPPSKAVRAEIEKRMSLNLIIQGAAAHTFLTASELVRDELEAIQPGLTRRYCRFAISGMLNYSIGEIALSSGLPHRWYGFSRRPQVPLKDHRFLTKYGGLLARESLSELRRMARAYRVISIPVIHWFQCMGLLLPVIAKDEPMAPLLEPLAKKVVTQFWDFPVERMQANLTTSVAFGHLYEPQTFLGHCYRMSAIGYGGVERRDGTFHVIAKARAFPLLIHELVKGIVELICLHGLHHLDEETYATVTRAADLIEYEPWFLQAGPAFWRRLVALAPSTKPLQQVLMEVAKLPPDELDFLFHDIMESPRRATRFLEEF